MSFAPEGRLGRVSSVSIGWSWAESEAVARAYQVAALDLVGEVIVAVATSTSTTSSRSSGTASPEPASSPIVAEWERPTWRHPACDTTDFAVELETGSGSCFTISWESPGEREGLGIRELPAEGNAYRDDTEVAIWDVTSSHDWRDLLPSVVTNVEMHTIPGLPPERCGATGSASRSRRESWSSCLRRVISTSPTPFSLRRNNVAVIFGAAQLPGWLVARETIKLY